MASTKALRTYIAAATANAAAATATGAVFAHTTSYGGTITAKIINGATPPTTGASVLVYISGDNFATAGKLIAKVTAGIVAGPGVEGTGTYSFTFNLPVNAMYSRVDVTGNVAQSVTCEAFLEELLTI